MRTKYIQQQHDLSTERITALVKQIGSDSDVVTYNRNNDAPHSGYINGSPYAIKLLTHKHNDYLTQFIPIDRFNKLIELFRKVSEAKFNGKSGVSPFLKQPACLYILHFIDDYYMVIDLLKANPKTMSRTLGRYNNKTGIAIVNYEIPNSLGTIYRLNMLHSNINLTIK